MAILGGGKESKCQLCPGVQTIDNPQYHMLELMEIQHAIYHQMRGFEPPELSPASIERVREANERYKGGN